jgi:hypothetical protein
MRIEKQTDVPGEFSVGLGAPPPGRPNGFQSGIFSAKKKRNEFLYI